jgi:chemotaxis signal transduction protein
MYDLAPATAHEHMFLTFRAHGRRYGIDVAFVREVSTHRTFVPVPQSPPLVRGLANLRSRIYLVLDVGPALGGDPSNCTADSRLIVFQEHVAENLGLLVDEGGDIVRVPAAHIEDMTLANPPESPAASAPNPVVALCKLEGELMMVIDPARIVAALENAIR